jgi:hypothetical protein
MHREHGDCPLHLVRMRWQWSQARLTRRLTGALPRRSGLLGSGAGASMVTVGDGVVGGGTGEVSRRILGGHEIMGSRSGPPLDTWTAEEQRPRRAILVVVGRNQDQDLWLESSMRPRGLREARSGRAQYRTNAAVD